MGYFLGNLGPKVPTRVPHAGVEQITTDRFVHPRYVPGDRKTEKPVVQQGQCGRRRVVCDRPRRGASLPSTEASRPSPSRLAGVSISLRRRFRALPDFPVDLPGFDPATAPADPVELFLEWLDHALSAGVPQPHAFSLATSTASGQISSRMLILKNIHEGAWHFASARGSRKGRELAANPQAAMNFYWEPLGRQVRVVGAVSLLSAEASALDWAERPGADGQANPDWQLYALHPTEVEFWQASPDRHHIRHRYAL